MTPIQPPDLLPVQTVIKPEVRERAALPYPPTSAFQAILQPPSPMMTSDVFFISKLPGIKKENSKSYSFACPHPLHPPIQLFPGY